MLEGARVFIDGVSLWCSPVDCRIANLVHEDKPEIFPFRAEASSVCLLLNANLLKVDCSVST